MRCGSILNLVSVFLLVPKHNLPQKQTMNIAAQLDGGNLQLFIEGVSWKKITQPFNGEKMKIDLLAFATEHGPVFHDAVTRSEPETHPDIMFCRLLTTLADFKRSVNKLDFGEPTELRCHNAYVGLTRKFNGAWLLAFADYANNPVFAHWLIQAVPVLEAGTMLHRIKTGMRYYTRGFAEYREFDSIEAFMQHRFELWHDETVAEYEKALANGTATCPGCEKKAD